MGFPDEAFFERLRDDSFLDAGAKAVLLACGCTFDQVEEALRAIFKRIAVPYSPHKAATIRRAEIGGLLKRCHLKSEPDQRWNASRDFLAVGYTASHPEAMMPRRVA